MQIIHISLVIVILFSMTSVAVLFYKGVMSETIPIDKAVKRIKFWGVLITISILLATINGFFSQ